LHRNQHDVAGHFLAGIPCEIDLRPTEDFVGRARRLEATTWQDLEHGYIDAARQWLATTPADQPRIAFTSTITRFENFVTLGDEPPLRWLGEPLHVHYQTADLGLEIILIECRGVLETYWFYDGSLFSDKVIEGLYRGYARGLEGLARNKSFWGPTEAIDSVCALELSGDNHDIT
jgi:hypothetical protein